MKYRVGQALWNQRDYLANAGALLRRLYDLVDRPVDLDIGAWAQIYSLDAPHHHRRLVSSIRVNADFTQVNPALCRYTNYLAEGCLIFVRGDNAGMLASGDASIVFRNRKR